MTNKDTKIPTKGRLAPFKVTYHHSKPRNDKKRQEQVEGINAIFNILFKAILESRNQEKRENMIN